LLRSSLQLFRMIRRFGFRTCCFRAAYAVRSKTGALKRLLPAESLRPCPRSVLEAWRNGVGGRFFFSDTEEVAKALEGILPAAEKARVVRCAEEIAGGRFPYFSHLWADAGMPPDWFRNPFTGERFVADRHWSEIGELAPDKGDIKFIWELSRFAWAFNLARVYVLTGDDKFAETFWLLFEDWVGANPPQRGVNWKCGQECAFRIVAFCFCLNAFRESRGTTDERVRLLIGAIASHARRIERNIEFALSLKNTHSISEAMGLFTAGVLFPRLRGASDWRRRGYNLLIKEALRQIYPDGSYIQHSMNYQRLALQSLLWSGRLAELNGQPFPPELLKRLEASLLFLYQMSDEKTGRMPNYGANDGVVLLPLNNCDYLDYRPVLQSMTYFLRRERLFDRGAWDEDAVWLFGAEALSVPLRSVKRVSFSADCGGYYTLRGERSWAFIRCHTYRDRPLQADMLHLDLWFDGENLLRDAGSFRYHCPEPWQSYFKSTAAHNTIEIDQSNQMREVGTFLWLHWTRSRIRHNYESPNGERGYWEGEHYGYCSLPCRAVHRRAVVRWRDTWIIIDDILGEGRATAALRWRLMDAEWRESGDDTFSTAESFRLRIFPARVDEVRSSLVRGKIEPKPEGWESLYYGERVAVPTVLVELGGRLPMRVITILECGAQFEWNFSERSIEARSGRDGLRVRLLAPVVSATRIALMR